MALISESRSVNSNPKAKGVRFCLKYDLKSLFVNFVQKEDRKLYEELVCKIRDIGQEIEDDELCELLKEARGSICILDRNLKLFVQVILLLKWSHRGEEVVSEYQGFLVDLCSAHNYYTKQVFDHLVTSFKFGGASSWDNGVPSLAEEKQYQNIHQVIKALLTVIPMSSELLLSSLNGLAPYLKRPALEHASFIYNCLRIIDYLPYNRLDILKLVTNKLIILDVHVSRCDIEEEGEEDHIFEMDEAIKSDEKVVSLDICMSILLCFIQSQCFKDGNLVWDRAKSLFSDIIKVFDSIILTTHATNHIQFIVFYMLSFKPAFAISFLQLLWNKVSNPCVAPIIRQASVSYIASTLARGAFIPVSVVQDMLIEMVTWIHNYIASQEGVAVIIQDTRIHGVFYATCQAIFYVIAFRSRELVNSPKGLVILTGLNLSKIVTCRLNPLRACLPVVVSHFASVARTYQLAYCYTVIERNARSSLPQLYRDSSGSESLVQVHLDTFFPFDPYSLQRSNSYIKAIYREYHGDSLPGEHECVFGKPENEEEDDFLEQSPVSHSPKSSLSTFCYGASPGFMHK